MIQSFGLYSIEVRRMLDACFSPRLSFEWVWPSEKVHGGYLGLPAKRFLPVVVDCAPTRKPSRNPFA